MSDERLEYDLRAMAEAHGDITSAARRFAQTHSDINDLIDRLRKTWTDSNAAAAWQKYHDEWNTVFADITAELASLGAAVDTARQNGANAEKANCDMWCR
ncbi:MAG: WXG100 family type VII secretion target [Jatrophihabitantaceae bacterium]